MKKLFALCSILVLTLSFSLVSLASEITPKVIFSAKDESFSFENVANVENPDLFTSFKDVISGDVINQKVEVHINDLEKTDTVKIYLQSETEDPVYRELLKSLNVTVENAGEDITARLADQVLLGTFKADDVVALNIKLDIPVTVGNEIKSLEAYTDWILTAEIIENSVLPKEEDTSSHLLPKTGDTTSYLLWVVLGVTALMGIVLVSQKIYNKSI